MTHGGLVSIDGVSLADGFGVLLEPAGQEHTGVLVVWLTERTDDGRFAKVRPLPREACVSMLVGDGDVLTIQDGRPVRHSLDADDEVLPACELEAFGRDVRVEAGEVDQVGQFPLRVIVDGKLRFEAFFTEKGD